MDSAQVKDALELTIGGVGIAVAVMVILLVVAKVMGWVFATPFVQRRTGALAVAEAAGARRRRAMAASIAVSVALAEGEGSAREDTSTDVLV